MIADEKRQRVNLLGAFDTQPEDPKEFDMFMSNMNETLYVFYGGEWKQFDEIEDVELYIQYPLTDDELDAISSMYATKMNSAYTNDFFGFRNGYELARDMFVGLAKRNPNDADLGRAIRKMLIEKGLL